MGFGVEVVRFSVEVVGIEASSRSISSSCCCGVKIWFSRVLVSTFPF